MMLLVVMAMRIQIAMSNGHFQRIVSTDEHNPCAAVVEPRAVCSVARLVVGQACK